MTDLIPENGRDDHSAALAPEFDDQEVYDGWASWRVRIETKERRGRPVYRWMAERKFTRWNEYRSGWWTRDIEKAVKRGRAYLDSKRRYSHEEVGYL